MITRLVRPAAGLAAALALVACSPAGEPFPTETDATPSASQDAAPTSSAEDGALDAWRVTATNRRGDEGEQFDYDCPPGGEPENVWGTDVYTDDSSVCTAAVHAGAITVEEGGSVVIEIRPGEDEYEASSRNGIDSLAYGPWGGSFVIVDE